MSSKYFSHLKHTLHPILSKAISIAHISSTSTEKEVHYSQTKWNMSHSAWSYDSLSKKNITRRRSPWNSEKHNIRRPFTIFPVPCTYPGNPGNLAHTVYVLPMPLSDPYTPESCENLAVLTELSPAFPLFHGGIWIRRRSKCHSAHDYPSSDIQVHCLAPLWSPRCNFDETPSRLTPDRALTNASKAEDS